MNRDILRLWLASATPQTERKTLWQTPSTQTTEIKPRKAKKGNEITPSNLRPHVLARDRMARWTTPYATDFQHSSSQLTSTASTGKLFDTILHSLDASTLKNYGAGLLRFTQFCDCNNIPETLRMPASELLLATFVANWSGLVSKSTIDTWTAGLTFWHTINGAKWNGGKMLRAACSGASKAQPPKQPKRPPVTIEHLHALRRGLDLTNSLDAAIYGVACTAFWCCRRLEELVIPSPGKFDPIKHMSKSAPFKSASIPGNKSYYVIHAPWSKTTKFAGVDIIATENDDPTSPVQAIAHHMRCNSRVPSQAPFFAYSTDSGKGWAPMTRSWFLDRCNAVWDEAGLERMTGHSFRIGGATELLLRGTAPDIVQIQGSWRSRAFLEYWRKIDSILPLFISNTFDQSRLKLIRDSLDNFQKRYS